MIHGTRYAVTYLVICYLDDDEDPVFGAIKDIIITSRNECLFILIPFVPVSYNSHFHAYEVAELNDNQILIYRQRELRDFHPLTISKTYIANLPQLFVSLKYHIFLLFKLYYYIIILIIIPIIISTVNSIINYQQLACMSRGSEVQQ